MSEPAAESALPPVLPALASRQRDGDLGVTASVLQAVAYADFDPQRVRTGGGG